MIDIFNLTDQLISERGAVFKVYRKDATPQKSNIQVLF